MTTTIKLHQLETTESIESEVVESPDFGNGGIDSDSPVSEVPEVGDNIDAALDEQSIDYSLGKDGEDGASNAAPQGDDKDSAISPGVQKFIDHLSTVATAKRKFTEAALLLAHYKQQMKSLKETIKEQEEQVATLAAEVERLGEKTEDWDSGDSAAEEEEDSDSELPQPLTRKEAEVAIAEAMAKQADSGNSDWAKTPTDLLGLDKIAGFGPKKLTAIFNAAPTLGKLESLRADTYNGGLMQIKGVGRDAADKIEDCILDWLSKNRDKEVLTVEAANGANANKSGATPTPVDTAKPAPASHSAPKPNSQPSSFATREAEIAALYRRLATLRDEVADGKHDETETTEQFDDGLAARQRGDEIDACNWACFSEECDQWLLGWAWGDVQLDGDGAVTSKWQEEGDKDCDDDTTDLQDD